MVDKIYLFVEKYITKITEITPNTQYIRLHQALTISKQKSYSNEYLDMRMTHEYAL